MEVQQKRDLVQKNLEEFKATNNRFMACINKKVTQGKEKHEELTTEASDFWLGHVKKYPTRGAILALPGILSQWKRKRL